MPPDGGNCEEVLDRFRRAAIGADHVRKFRLDAEQLGETAFAFERVPHRHIGRLEMDQHLVRPDAGHGQRFQRERLRAAELVDCDGLHGVILVPHFFQPRPRAGPRRQHTIAYGMRIRPSPLVQPSGFKARCGPWLSARMEGPYSSFPRIGARDCGDSRMKEALRFPDLGLRHLPPGADHQDDDGWSYRFSSSMRM
jgi:hypothetical protein